jgi:transcription elongation factor Elf1
MEMEWPIWKEETEIETDYKKNITCPYCGWEDTDSWENNLGDGDQEKLECGNCEQFFLVRCDVDITYTSSKIIDKKRCRERI